MGDTGRNMHVVVEALLFHNASASVWTAYS